MNLIFIVQEFYSPSEWHRHLGILFLARKTMISLLTWRSGKTGQGSISFVGVNVPPSVSCLINFTLKVYEYLFCGIHRGLDNVT